MTNVRKRDFNVLRGGTTEDGERGVKALTHFCCDAAAISLTIG